MSDNLLEIKINVDKRLLVEKYQSINRQAAKLLSKLADVGAEDVQDNYTKNRIPSRPGEPPAIRTGRLLRSTKSDKRAVTQSLSTRIVAGMYYASFLEFGTHVIAPRPFMRPAALRLADRIPAIAKSEGFFE